MRSFGSREQSGLARPMRTRTQRPGRDLNNGAKLCFVPLPGLAREKIAAVAANPSYRTASSVTLGPQQRMKPSDTSLPAGDIRQDASPAPSHCSATSTFLHLMESGRDVCPSTPRCPVSHLSELQARRLPIDRLRKGFILPLVHLVSPLEEKNWNMGLQKFTRCQDGLMVVGSQECMTLIRVKVRLTNDLDAKEVSFASVPYLPETNKV